jgi:hypothetical protein
MEQYKEYPIIQVDGGAVIVKIPENPSDDARLITNPVFKGSLKEDKLFEIIAHTGIKSLKDSNLPLFEINDTVEKLFDIHYKNINYTQDSIYKDSVRRDFMAGYKAGGYTEEDMKNAIRISFGQAKQSKLSVGEIEKRILKSLKKYPTSALVAMTTTKDFMSDETFDKVFDWNAANELWDKYKPYLLPKVDRNNHLIIKEFKYE